MLAAAVLGLIAYALFEPRLEKALGTPLPGFNDEDQAARAPAPRKDPEPTRAPRDTPSKPAPPADPPRPQAPATGVRTGPDRAGGELDVERLIRSADRGVYVSPGGLRYGRGSQHGHRLRHLMFHTQDEPDRVGQHGVFDSTSPQEVLALVDQAYKLARSGQRTRVEREADRTIYTVNLGRRIGYIGGQSGGRRNHPPATHLRMVLDEDYVITAFPVRP